jgi:DNA-directed RNA polymerase subunit RPC12/RpoP
MDSAASGNSLAVSRPTACPFCGSKALGTLAKVLSRETYWRCAKCGQGWSIASLAMSARLPATRRVL